MTQKYQWPPKAGNVCYRVTVRDMETGENIGVLRNLKVNACEIPEDWAQRTSDAAVRVEVANVDEQGNCGEFHTWVPFVQLSPWRDTIFYTLESWHLGAEAPDERLLIRLFIREEKSEKIVHDRTWKYDHKGVPVPSALYQRIAAGDLYPELMRYDTNTGQWMRCVNNLSMYFDSADFYNPFDYDIGLFERVLFREKYFKNALKAWITRYLYECGSGVA